MMGDMSASFPYLDFKTERKAIEVEITEILDDDDGDREYKTRNIIFDEEENDIWIDDEEFDYEMLLKIAEGTYTKFC